MRAPLCDPDLPHTSGQFRRERYCLPPGSRRRPRQLGSYEAESRGPHAHCLRFAASATRNTTQDSFPAGGQPLLGGILTHQVPSKGFKSRHGHPPFPSLLGARTILPSGPRSAIASFGSSKGRSRRRRRPHSSIRSTSRLWALGQEIDGCSPSRSRGAWVANTVRDCMLVTTALLIVSFGPNRGLALRVSLQADRLVRCRTPSRLSTSEARWLRSFAPSSTSRGVGFVSQRSWRSQATHCVAHTAIDESLVAVIDRILVALGDHRRGSALEDAPSRSGCVGVRGPASAAPGP